MKKITTFLTLLLLLGALSTHITYADNTGVNGDQRGDNCVNDPKNPHCDVSAPEFGAISGVFATISSAGAYLLLKKRIAK